MEAAPAKLGAVWAMPCCLENLRFANSPQIDFNRQVSTNVD